MCSDCLVLRGNSSTLKVPDLCKYFQNPIKYIGIDTDISSFFSSQLAKNEQIAILISIHLIKFLNFYTDLEPQKSMSLLLTLSHLSTSCQAISKIQKSQKSVAVTLPESG